MYVGDLERILKESEISNFLRILIIGIFQFFIPEISNFLAFPHCSFEQDLLKIANCMSPGATIYVTRGERQREDKLYSYRKVSF